MKNLETISTELFNKIRGRFPNITVGDESATITNKPNEARFFEFDFADGKKVNVNIDQDSLTIMYGQDLFSEDENVLKSKWYDFLKELRVFAKKRMLNFDTRDITKSNLDKRDYEYLSTEKQMSESKMYGTSRTSYQNVGTARLVVKHAGPVNMENAAGRTQNVHSIYIESDAGERFKYPFRHLNGARAMARHVAEGGNAYDVFGKHITGLSEELANLRKFKTYMNRSSVMAEGLAGYMDTVNERLNTVKKTVEMLQRESYYKESFANFEQTVMEDVPEDIATDWTAQLTIKQFNEELKDVFPYIYKLVSEANKVVDLGPEELLGEGGSEADEQMIDSWYDEVVGAITNRNITFPIAELKIEKIVDVVADDWGDQGPGSDVVLSIINRENDQTTQDAIEAKQNEAMGSEYHCRDCGDTPHNPTTNCSHDVHDENGDHWVDDNGNGIHDADEGVVDMDHDYAEHLDTIISSSNHERGPQTTLEELVAESQLDENLLKIVGGALAKVLPKIGGNKETLSTIADLAGKGVAGTAKTIVKNPGKSAAIGGGAYVADKVGDAMDAIPDALAAAGDKIVSSADDLMAFGKGALANIPNINQIATMAARNALPIAAVVAAIYGGYKLLDMAFGKEPNKDHESEEGEQEQKNEEIPLEEYIKSMYDYTTNAFPKGETAVLTAVEKDYGEHNVEQAHGVMSQLLSGNDDEMARIQHLAGLR